MSAFHRAAPPAEQEPVNAPPATERGLVHALRGTHGQPSLLRGRVSRRRTAGQFVLVWIAAYVSLRPWAGILPAAAKAFLVTAVWLNFLHWTNQFFRAMTFAAGTFVVAATASLAGASTIAALSFWWPTFNVDRSSLIVVGVAAFLAVGSWDYFVRQIARAPRRVLIVGGGAATVRFLDDLARDPNVALEVIAIVDDNLSETLAARVGQTAALKGLASTIRRTAPDLVVIAVQRGRPDVFAQLLGVADAGFEFVGLPELYEFAFGRLPVEELTPAWFMSVLHAYNRPSSLLAKRAFDVVVAVFGIIVALPLMPAILIVVKRTPGPLFYRQKRVGENGRNFTMLKFRSMREDAEQNGKAEWASQNDSRIIQGGRLMRLLRLDELPQLWNVLRGEMSIVGPRPERPEFFEQLEAEVPFWTQRQLLRPGITGWAQIRAAYAADTLGTVEKLSYDLWYLRHRSIVLDVIICLKTFPQMALFRGAR